MLLKDKDKSSTLSTKSTFKYFQIHNSYKDRLFNSFKLINEGV